MLHSADHSVGNQLIDRVGLSRCQTAEPMSDRQRSPILATGKSVRPKPTTRPQLIVDVRKALCDCECVCPRSVGLTHRTLRMKQRQTKRRIELHFAARVSAQTESDMGTALARHALDIRRSATIGTIEALRRL